MEYTIITSGSFSPVRWSGGSTTELYIFPPTADYRLRNFLFRLSTATVEKEQTDFTSLSGISRKLMVLSGETTLYHENHYSRRLKKFDTDAFEGDWETSSAGQCTDFNLMTTGGISGELRAAVIKRGLSFHYIMPENDMQVIIYVYSGQVRTCQDDKTATLNAGDLLVFNRASMISLEITGIENSEVVFTEIT